MINPMDLTEKHILITGGSSGIGQACAVQASRLGARVTIIGRDVKRLEETIQMMDHKSRQAMYDFDLNEIDCIESLINRIVKERGAVNGFCHAAGIATVRPLKMCKRKFIEKMFRIHEYAFIELIRCLSLKNNLKDGASLVGISSSAAKRGAFSQCAYSAAKASMDGFVPPAALELGRRGIRINTISFSLVSTRMYEEFVDYGGDMDLVNRQHLGVINTESAANMIVFVLSDACPYITGASIPVWAGF